MTPRVLDEHELLLQSARRVLFQAMLDKGISQSSLARKLGQTEGQVSRVLHSNDTVTLRTLARFSEAVGVRFEFARVKEES
jgi:transcriptional regulator with XRE-family HTH domain